MLTAAIAFIAAGIVFYLGWLKHMAGDTKRIWTATDNPAA
jgi:hypothetical protein